MKLVTRLFTLCIFQQCKSVTIDTTSNDPYIVVELSNDPRGINEITVDNYWKMYQALGNPLYDWGLQMTLASDNYAFQSGQESKLTIEMDGFCETTACDVFYAFSVGDKYIAFAQDFDGALWVNNRLELGIYIYPACNANSIATGDASQLLSQAEPRVDLAGGPNWHRLTPSQNGNNFPVTFEFINDDITDTFTFKFKSSTFPTGLECVYNSTFPTEEDFKFYLTPDADMEILKVKRFEISGDNLGTPCGCYQTELLSTTTDGEGSRCYLYQVSFCDDELDSVFLERDRAFDSCGADIVSLMTSWEPTDLSFFVKSRSEGIEGIHVNGLSDGDIFRFCFDASQVRGTSDGGFIEYYRDIQRYSCPVSNTLFNLCGGGAGGVAAHSFLANPEGFIIGHSDENNNEVDQPPMVMRFIWSGLIAMIVSIMVVLIAYVICIKPKENSSIYTKVMGNDQP